MHYELMVRAAYYYYQREYTQTKIAEMLGISRLTLGRILKEARDTGVVKIEISDPRNMTHLLDTESRLCDRFSLANAIVVDPITQSDEDRLWHIAGAASQYISRTIRSGMKISISWGKTISIMVDRLPNDKSIRDIEVSTVLGGANTTDTYVQPGMLAGAFISRYSGKGHVINAPFICQSEEVGISMKNEPGVKSVMEKCLDADLAIIGIGETPSFSPDYWARGSYSDETMEQIIASGAVGDICGSYIDASGRPCCPEINRRLVAIAPEDLKKIRNVVAIAGGDNKTESIRAALRGGYVSTLITDYFTAEEILQ